MKISAGGMELLKRSEGFRNRVYLDVAGLATIGYGHRLLHSESFPDGIDSVQASELLAADVRDAEQAVERMVKVPLAQSQFDALVDFVFNLGAGRFATSTLLKCLNAGRYDEAVKELLRWNRAAGQEIPALRNRREAEVKLWQSAHSEQQAA
jgi:lysozyme